MRGNAEPGGSGGKASEWDRKRPMVSGLGGSALSLPLPLAEGTILRELVASNPQRREVKVGGECQSPEVISECGGV